MAAGLVHSVFDAFTLMKRSAYTGEAAFGGDKVRSSSLSGIESIDQARAALDEIMNDKTNAFHDPSSPDYNAAQRDVMLLHRKAYNPISRRQALPAHQRDWTPPASSPGWRTSWARRSTLPSRG